MALSRLSIGFDLSRIGRQFRWPNRMRSWNSREHAPDAEL
jgi:hypothetical protein